MGAKLMDGSEEVLSKTLASTPQSSTMRSRMLFWIGGVVGLS